MSLKQFLRVSFERFNITSTPHSYNSSGNLQAKLNKSQTVAKKESCNQNHNCVFKQLTFSILTSVTSFLEKTEPRRKLSTILTQTINYNRFTEKDQNYCYTGSQINRTRYLQKEILQSSRTIATLEATG